MSASLGASLSPVNKEKCTVRVQRTLVRLFFFFFDTFHLRGWIVCKKTLKCLEILIKGEISEHSSDVNSDFDTDLIRFVSQTDKLIADIYVIRSISAQA